MLKYRNIEICLDWHGLGQYGIDFSRHYHNTAIYLLFLKPDSF